MKSSLIYVAFAFLFVVGCASRPRSADDDRDASRQIVCNNADECAKAWRRAQIWITQNSDWKIQTATDAIIETYNGDRYSSYRHYQVTREPLAGQQERIRMASGCNNMLGCSGDAVSLEASFNRYVRSSISSAAQTAGPATPLLVAVPAASWPQAAASVPSAPQGKFGFDAERAARDAGCRSNAQATLTAKVPGLETYTVSCIGGDVMSVRCEFSNCRALQ